MDVELSAIAICQSLSVQSQLKLIKEGISRNFP